MGPLCCDQPETLTQGYYLRVDSPMINAVPRLPTATIGEVSMYCMLGMVYPLYGSVACLRDTVIRSITVGLRENRCYCVPLCRHILGAMSWTGVLFVTYRAVLYTSICTGIHTRRNHIG